MAFSLKKYRLPQVLTEPELYKIAEHYGCSTGFAKGYVFFFLVIMYAIFLVCTLRYVLDTRDYIIGAILLPFLMAGFVIFLRLYLSGRKSRSKIQADLADGRVVLKKTRITDIRIEEDSDGYETRTAYFSDGSQRVESSGGNCTHDLARTAKPGMTCYLLFVGEELVFFFLENEMVISGEVQARVIDATGQNG